MFSCQCRHVENSHIMKGFLFIYAVHNETLITYVTHVTLY